MQDNSGVCRTDEPEATRGCQLYRLRALDPRYVHSRPQIHRERDHEARISSRPTLSPQPGAAGSPRGMGDTRALSPLPPAPGPTSCQASAERGPRCAGAPVGLLVLQELLVVEQQVPVEEKASSPPTRGGRGAPVPTEPRPQPMPALPWVGGPSLKDACSRFHPPSPLKATAESQGCHAAGNSKPKCCQGHSRSSGAEASQIGTGGAAVRGPWTCGTHPSLSSTSAMLALVMMASSHLNHWSLCCRMKLV